MPWLAKKTSPLTEEFLEEFDRLDKEARPGPWELEKQPGTETHAVSRVIAGFFAWKAPTPDARLIVQMRNALFLADHRSQGAAHRKELVATFAGQTARSDERVPDSTVKPAIDHSPMATGCSPHFAAGRWPDSVGGRTFLDRCALSRRDPTGSRAAGEESDFAGAATPQLTACWRAWYA